MKEEFFSAIEGQRVLVQVTTENSDLTITLPDVCIGPEDDIGYNNDFINIDFDIAVIKKEDDETYIVELPEISYYFSVLSA